MRERQVAAAVDLLDGGATVPFIARYRKEATEMLDDTQLRTLEERLRYLRELEERRAAILESIRSQGKLDDALEAQIMAADSKARLEDIYLPYKPKRRTKAQIAREAGLEPLADQLLDDPTLDPQTAAASYVDSEKGVADAAAALDGARAILIERFAEDADLIGDAARADVGARAGWCPRYGRARQEAGAKFSDYFDFAEPFTKLPSHRILAMFRGEKEEVLDLAMEPDGRSRRRRRSYEPLIAGRFGIPTRAARPTSGCRTPCAGPGARASSSTSASTCGCGCGRRPRTRRCACSRRTCATCCWPRRPAPGPRWAWTPGFRTGVKVAVVDATGKVVATDTIYPHVPQRQWDESIAILARLADVHKVELIAIGNGTASRETDKLAGDLITAVPAAEADQGRWCPRPAPRCTRRRRSPPRSCPAWTCRCAARSRSPGACRTRWPSW